MLERLRAALRNRSIVEVNGIRVEGSNVSIVGDAVYVDGKKVEGVSQGPINVQIHGDVQELHTGSGNVRVDGSAGSVQTGSGDVSCGAVGGNVQTGSGDVTCGNIAGAVRTGSGDISHR